MSKILAARKAANLTQEKMSELTGIPRRTIQDWESERRIPPVWVERLVLKELKEIEANHKEDKLTEIKQLAEKSEFEEFFSKGETVQYEVEIDLDRAGQSSSLYFSELKEAHTFFQNKKSEIKKNIVLRVNKVNESGDICDSLDLLVVVKR